MSFFGADKSEASNCTFGDNSTLGDNDVQDNVNNSCAVCQIY